jgi:hypothetical protein
MTGLLSQGSQRRSLYKNTNDEIIRPSGIDYRYISND